VVSPDGLWRWDGERWEPRAPSEAPGAIPQDVVYGGFWVRLGAYIVDALAINVVAIPLNLVLFGNAGFQCCVQTQTAVNRTIVSVGIWAYGTGAIVSLILGGVYLIAMWSTGATLGQRLCGLRVLDEETGKPLRFFGCLICYVGFVISFIPLGLGLIWAAADSRKQGWHDKMAHSVVLRNTRIR